MIRIFARAGDYPIEFITCIILAAMPTLIWIWLFNKKHKERKSAIIITFILGMCSALIILIYQYFWGKEFNIGFFAIEPLNFQKEINTNFSHPIIASILVFFSVGLIEEYSKHWVIKKADQRFFRSIDDVIELSIIAALGFAFLENIGYFFQTILRDDPTTDLLQSFFMRSVFVTFVHILCSGIYGYFYGVGYFSKCVFKDKCEMGKKFIVPELIHKIFHLKSERVFHDEMISLGLIISVTIHALYDIMLDLNLNLGQILRIDALNNVNLYSIVLPIMLIFGFYFLDTLLSDKEDQKVFGIKTLDENFSGK